MDENNQEMQAPKQPTKKEKAQQAGKDVAEVAAKGAANYFGGPVGGAIANKVAQSKLGQNVLNAAGKTLASNPVTKNALAKAQPAIQQAKPMLNAAAGSLGGNAGGAAGAADGAKNATQAANGSNSLPTNSNPSTSSSSGLNNSGFGNGKSGLFSPGKGSDENQGGSASGDLGASFKKAKNTIKIIGMIAPVLFPMIICAVVAFVVIGQIMIIRDNIDNLVQQFNTGIEKFVNFAQGNGLVTNEEAFFNKLNDEYDKFPYTGGDRLDVALIAATIHYSTTVDLNQFEESETIENENEDSGEEIGTSDVPITGTLNEKNTVAFYRRALEMLGSPNTKVLGQKRLLGYAVTTDISVDVFTWTDAIREWKEFFTYLYETIGDTLNDFYWDTAIAALNPTTSFSYFRSLYDEMTGYLNENRSMFSGWEYDARNQYYEVQESWYRLMTLLDDFKDVQEYETEPEDKKGLKWVIAPDIQRTMNYGYDEYKQMQRDVVEMKSILTANGIEYTTDEDVLDNAKNSSNTELKKLYEDYEKNEHIYMYSYTHYLQKVYIPFNFCYKSECSTIEIDRMIDEIFDQRDFYYYLMGDESDLTAGCGYSYSGDPVDIEINVEMLNNIYVNVLHYEETSRTSTNIAETVSLKDYVTGVLYREVGASTSDNEEYLKANIIAIKSYTIGRPKVMGDSITNDGEKYYLTMRNNTNDQVYCSLTNGCMDAPSNKKPAPSQELIDYIGRLYDEVANEFLYDSATGNFTGSYRDKASTCAAAGATGHCMGQRESKELGESGNNWETILATFYEDSIGIVDITTSTLSTSVLSCITPGLQLGHSGYSVRTSAPTSGSKYFIPPWNGSTLGQCAWYAKGRALEIVDTVNASQEKKNLAIETIKQIYANGNQWYHEKLLEVFAHSTDYTLPREGAIVVYDWVSPDANGNRYGHVAIVEKVEGNLVYVSDGWNSCGGAYGEASWNCIGFAYRPVTIEQMQNLGRPDYYKFIGYVYLLD